MTRIINTRHFLIPSIAIALLTMFSCAKEIEGDGGSKTREQTILSASVEQVDCDTKTSLSSSLAVLWSSGDRISVLTENHNEVLTLYSGAGTSNATFAGYVSHSGDCAIVYPYNGSTSYSSDVVNLGISSSQAYTASSFASGANPAVYFGNTSDLKSGVSFKNIFGVLKVVLKGSGSPVKITVTDKTSGSLLWGTCRISREAFLAGTVPCYTLSGGSNVLTMTVSGVSLTSEGTAFYFCVPLGAFKDGLELRVYGSEDSSACTLFETSQDNSIERSTMTSMPVKEVEVPVCYNLENEVAGQYLSEITYPDDDYSISYITNYSSQSTSYRKDQAAGVPITWTTQEGLLGQRIDFSFDSGFSTYVSYDVSTTTAESMTVYNLIPQRRYYYRVIGGTSSGLITLKTGIFDTSGYLRMLKYDSVHNMRDIGGKPTIDGKRLKYGLIYRSGAFNQGTSAYDINVTASDAKRICTQLNIAVDVDFRGDSESGDITASPLGNSVGYRRIPLGSYTHVLTSKTFGTVFSFLLPYIREGKACDLHCVGGADRTGSMIMLLEALCGVTEDYLSKDYELTSFSTYGTRQRNYSTETTPSDIPFRTMMEQIKAQYEGDTFQQKVYNLFINFYGVSKADLDEYVSLMTE